MVKALAALLLALILDLILGDLPNRFHPVAAMGALIHWADEHCTWQSNLAQFIYGMFLIILGGALFSLPWWFLSGWISSLPFWPSVLLTGLFLKPVFAFRGLIEAGEEIRTALAEDKLVEARRLTGWHLVSRRTQVLSAGQVVSAVVESLAENLTDSFLAPLFFFLAGGLPIAWLYRFVNTADAMIGYHTERYEYLGKFTARLDDVLNWLPARLAALTLVAASGFCRMNILRAWQVMQDQHQHTNSPNAGWTMTAAAGALGVRLEKIGCYVLNADQPLPAVKDIRRGSRLISTAALIGIIIMGGFGFGISLIF
jgi:adenosylcobinamide-phosphate synthase